MRTILLVERIPLLREALSLHLESTSPRCSVIIHPGSQDLLDSLHRLKPELLWLDGEYDAGQDKEFLPALCACSPVLVYGNSLPLSKVRYYFRQGIRAFLLKTAPFDEIACALGRLADGQTYLPDCFAHELCRAFTGTAQPAKRQIDLTRREREVLNLIVEEFTTKEIAQKLFISLNTAESHRIHLIQKLGVKNTAGLVRVALEDELYSRA